MFGWYPCFLRTWTVWLGVATCLATQANSSPILVPNGSFESPDTLFVSVEFPSWNKGPEPSWYATQGAGYLWEQLIGVFKNPNSGQTGHLDNLDGVQACWLFAVPEVELFQDYQSVDGFGGQPTGDLDLLFEVGKAYRFTVSLAGNGGGMRQGTTLSYSCYYRENSSNRITVAETLITNTTALFPNQLHLRDFEVQVPVVQATDPWAGKRLGISLKSTVSWELRGGYWDIDSFRGESFESTSAPITLSIAKIADGQVEITVESQAGARLEILASTNPSQPLDGWSVIRELTNQDGTARFSQSPNEAERRYYAARLVDGP